jgi:hypothetical protein
LRAVLADWTSWLRSAPGAGLGHGLVLAVGLAGLVGSGRQPGEGLEGAAVGEPPWAAHRGDELGGADWAQSGQAGGQPGRVEMDHGGVPGVLVPGSLGLGGPDQADLAGDLGGQVLDRDGAVTLPQRNRLGGRGAQRLGLGLTELAPAGGDDQPGQPARPGGQQRSRVGVALQHGQVGVAQPLAQGPADHGDELLSEGPGAGLAPADLGGQTGHGPHPTVQRRPRRAAELDRGQPGGGDQRQPGQGLGVDAVALGVPGKEPAQVGGLGRGHPQHGMAAAAEEHRDRQPRRPGRLDDHDQLGARVGGSKRGRLQRSQAGHRGAGTTAGADAAGVVDHHGGVVAGDAKVDPEQANR